MKMKSCFQFFECCIKTKNKVKSGKIYPITAHVNSAMNQSEFETNICHWYQARENACEQVTIGVGFASHWLEKMARIGHSRVALSLIAKREAKCKVFIMKNSLIHMQTKQIFILKSFVLCLVFMMRLTTTLKWPILLNNHSVR